jgi:hypothetical protein
MTTKKPERKRDQLHFLLDEHLKLSRWPSRRAQRVAALDYLATKFRDERTYTELEVNGLIRYWCAFDDPALLRRELCDWGFLLRTRDGSKYWKVDRGGAAAYSLVVK